MDPRRNGFRESAVEGAVMGKIWLALAVLGMEAVLLVWLVGEHVLQWGRVGGMAGQ